MPISYVIDGYNLIHALGMIQKQLAPGGLEESRRRLLVFLAQAFGADAAQVTIVFDAKLAPRGLPRQQSYQTMHIHFAPSKDSADDLIESMIEESADPTKLVVVSNDMRLQSAAQRRGARAWSHELLLNFLESRQQTAMPASGHEHEKDERNSPEDVKRWLKEFAHLESDPELKEFFDMDRFD